MRPLSKDIAATRGKMASLPYDLLMEVNRRLWDGDSQAAILAWLNGHPEVIGVMSRQFDGAPINSENISAWYQRDYRVFRGLVCKMASAGVESLHPTRLPARKGKIARLPHRIRAQINERMHQGETYFKITAWLNEEPSVVDRMRMYFDGAAISTQNLSKWRASGFAEWLARREYSTVSARGPAAQSHDQ